MLNHDNISKIQITPLAKKFATKNNINIENISSKMRRIHIKDLRNSDTKSADNNSKIFISPYAKKLALEKSLEINDINGTGPLNRIISRDIIDVGSKTQFLKPNKLRQAIAKATIHSKQNIPHFYLNSKVNINEVLSFRKKEKQKGNKYSFNAILMLAITRAFKNFSDANCTYQDNGDFIINEDINVGIAVDTETGLKMPVLKKIKDDDLALLNDNLNNLIN